METYEISPIAKCHPLRANVHSFCLNQLDSSVFLFILRDQVVFTAKILQNGESLRKFDIAIDKIRQLNKRIKII